MTNLSKFLSSTSKDCKICSRCSRLASPLARNIKTSLHTLQKHRDIISVLEPASTHFQTLRQYFSSAFLISFLFEWTPVAAWPVDCRVTFELRPVAGEADELRLKSHRDVACLAVSCLTLHTRIALSSSTSELMCSMAWLTRWKTRRADDLDLLFRLSKSVDVDVRPTVSVFHNRNKSSTPYCLSCRRVHRNCSDNDEPGGTHNPTANHRPRTRISDVAKGFGAHD